MKKNYCTVGTVPKSKIVERDKIDTLNTQIHDPTPSWVGTGSSVKSDGVKRILWAQI
jgi:hypothetical protein